jgi:hypothetical protein
VTVRLRPAPAAARRLARVTRVRATVAARVPGTRVREPLLLHRRP